MYVARGSLEVSQKAKIIEYGKTCYERRSLADVGGAIYAYLFECASECI